MPAGFKYDIKGQEVEKELWNQKTTHRLPGGFNLRDADLVEGSIIPPLAPLAINFKTREAKVVKNVKAVENINDTELKVAKGHVVKAGMHIGNGKNGATVSVIDKTNENYDVLTLSETITGVKKGDVLFELKEASGKSPKNVANFLNYARVKVEKGATITAIGQAYDIQEDKLYLPISKEDKELLTSRFMFI